MRKSWLGFALAGALAAAGCKDASSTSTQTQSSDNSSSSNPGRGRTGKVELGTPGHRPELPSEDTPATESDDTRHRDRPSLEDLEERRRKRMAELDTDGDGKISEEERKLARHKRAEDMLSHADADGDGKVTPDELAQGRFRRLDPASLDTNKDGTVSVDELDAALAAKSRAWGGGRFGRFDRAGALRNRNQGSADGAK